MIKETLKNLEERMKKTISFLNEELGQVRAGRANPMILDKINVEYYGSETPLRQLAGVSVPEPRMIQIQPYDASALKDIERAIQAANIGINPSNDGKVIRLVLPLLTEERRMELTKDVKKIGEDAKIAIRNERRDAIEEVKKMEKDKEITEDEKAKAEKDVQKLVDDFVEKIDDIVEKKSKEIMEV